MSNFISSHSTHKIIVVGRKPQFDAAEETDIEYIEDSLVYLDCSASGYPKPTVSIINTSKVLFVEMFCFGSLTIYIPKY